MMTREELEKQFEYLLGNAKRYTGKPPRTCKRSSLHMIIKTKEQAEDLMKAIEEAAAAFRAKNNK